MAVKHFGVDVTHDQMEEMLVQYTPLIKKYTAKFGYRAAGLGCALDKEDLEQELICTFIKCVRAYDPERGAAFMTFVINAFFHEVNRLMRKDQRNIEAGRTVSNVAKDDADGEFSIFDNIDSGWASPEQNLAALQLHQQLVGKLSPAAAAIVGQLVDPSDQVCEQFDLHVRGIESRRASTIDGPAARIRPQLNLNFLFELFNVPAGTARKLRQEIEQNAAVVFA